MEGEDLLCWRGISGTLSHSIILGHDQVFLDSGSDPRAALAVCCVLSHRPHQDGRAKIFWPGRYENGKKKEYTSLVRPLEDVTVPRKVAFHREAISQGRSRPGGDRHHFYHVRLQERMIHGERKGSLCGW